MRKAWVIGLALVMVASFGGCTARQTRINSYVLPGSNVTGDASKDVGSIESIVVWPLFNVAVGSKAKGVELILTDYLVDRLYLENSFKSVYILNEAEAKDLIARAGEELGLKKKPKEPTQTGLVTTKIGQLTNSDAILIGRIDDYDEVKVDKITYTAVGLSFFLFDARETAYPTLDSFTPARSLWRTNSIRSAKETAFQARSTLHETARILVNQIVDRMQKDMAGGSAKMSKAEKKKIKDLKKQASRQSKAGEYAAAIATWNAILKLDPANKDAPKAIAKIEEAEKKAAEKAKAEEMKGQIDALAQEADELEKSGDLQDAKSKWEEVLAVDEGNKEAQKRIEIITETLTSEAASEKEQDVSANLHLAQKALGEMKYTEAIAAAKKVLAADPGNAKAESVIEAAEQKLEEATAAEDEVKSAPVEPPAEEKAVKKAEPKEEVEKEAPAAEPAAAAADISDVEKLRNDAMEHFNSEDYAKAEEAWKKLLEIDPGDKQAQEMLETTQMLIEALK